ncbi:MAG TPA: twin-arginine translocation signal domain-containing protein, partial [Acidobacteriaceae bacterium]
MTEKIDASEKGVGFNLTRRTFLGRSTVAIAGAVISANCGEALAASPGSNSKVPVLLHVSDAVKPGQLFSVNGEWLDPKNLEVLVSTKHGRMPPANALKASIVQTDDQGHFVVVTMPQLRPAIFRVWVKNGAGFSAPIVMNKPRPLFLSECEAWAGQQ